MNERSTTSIDVESPLGDTMKKTPEKFSLSALKSVAGGTGDKINNRWYKSCRGLTKQYSSLIYSFALVKYK